MGTRFEVSSVGWDENLIGVGGGPAGGAHSMGLAVPPMATPHGDRRRRYLFELAFARFASGMRARLRGLRQYLEIGTLLTGAGGCQYPLNIEVTSPRWRFVDGNVQWSVMRVQPLDPFYDTRDIDSLKAIYGTAPALLYSTPPAAIDNTYAPPWGGVPEGTPVAGDLGGFTDLRYPWQSPRAWDDVDILIEGPCDVVFFASVFQTDPNTRCDPALPQGVSASTVTGMGREDAFLANFPTTVYTRIGGAMTFEIEDTAAGAVPDPCAHKE